MWTATTSVIAKFYVITRPQKVLNFFEGNTFLRCETTGCQCKSNSSLSVEAIKMHKDLQNSHSSPNSKSRIMRWAGNVARMKELRNANKIFVGKPVEKRKLRQPNRRWKITSKMDLTEIGFDELNNWLMIRARGGCCDQCNERPCFIQIRKFLL
jgi:hypothetical protein